MKNILNKFVGLLAICGWLLSAGGSYAQDGSDERSAHTSGLEEIVVTATKRGESLLIDVPLAIQAFSQSTLDKKLIRELQDLVTAIPGASQLSQVGSSSQVFSIRGSGAGGAVGDGLVGYYIDDVSYGIPNFQGSPPIRFFDLDRVEVLRGPQGTLYGQGSMGGTIVYRTRDPDLSQFSARGGLGVSMSEDAEDLNYEIFGAVSIPLAEDKLALGLSAGNNVRAGYADAYGGATPTGQPFREDANEIENTDYRVDLLWEPNERLRVRAQHWNFRAKQGYIQMLTSVEPPLLLNQGTFVGFEEGNNNLSSLTISYDFNNVTLTNAAGYQDTSPNEFGLGLDIGPPLGVGSLVLGNTAKSFVNELRLRSNTDHPLQWLAGASYRDAEGAFHSVLDFPEAEFYLVTENTTETESLAFFGELSYEFFDGKFVPLVGLRYYEDERSGIDVTNGTVDEANPDVMNWHVNLAFYPYDSTTFFFNSGTGFRSGIIQSETQAAAAITDGIPASTGLEPDELTSFELGVKTLLVNGALQLNASIYKIFYEDYQGSFTTSIGLSSFANFGDAESTGLDLEIGWDTPIEGLSLAFSGNVNNSEYTDVVPGFSAALPAVSNGERLINTPAYNWRADIDYSSPPGPSGWEMIAHASAAQTDGLYLVDQRKFETWETYSLSLGVRKGRYEITLSGENLSDYRGPVTSNGPTLFAGPYPRTIGIRVLIRDAAR